MRRFGTTTTSHDPFTRGLDYLYDVRGLAVAPEMVTLVHDQRDRARICTWIGNHIAAVNAQLQTHLQACQACFHPWEQPTLQILAAPLAPVVGLAGLCNFQTRPWTLLIDVGRVVPAHWLRLVAHEYAHAQVGTPGHHAPFAQALAQLCLGLALAPALGGDTGAAVLCAYPPCQVTADPLAFWQGATAWRHD